MSIFRPLNSDESNLFTIRCVITFSSEPSGMIAGGSKITVVTSLLTAPTSNNLPDYFGIFFSGGIFYATYGKEFTSTPCVSIMPRMSAVGDLSNNSSVGDNPIPLTFWNNIQKYEDSAYPNASNYNFAFGFKEATNGNLISTSASTKINGFDLIITGPVKLGVTTGNSNKGWSVGSGNDATTAYSYMDIGIGKGNPVCSLDINGGFKTTTLVLTDTTPVITAKDSGKLVTLDASGGSISLNLPTPVAGLNYKFVLVANSANTITITSTSDGSNPADISYGRLINAGSNTSASGVDVLTISASGKIGDTAECICDGTNWHWNCFSSESSIMTLA